MRLAGISALSGLALLAVSCGGGGRGVEADTVSGEAMGTTWRVTVASDVSQAEVDALGRAAGNLIEELEARFSHWRADSEVSRLNAAGTGEQAEVSSETRELIALAEEIGEASGGAFDIRVGKEVSGRGFGPERPAGGGAAFDLSGIAKGHAVDRVAELLDSRGHENYLVEIGGELKARGVNDRGDAWTVGVEAPDPDGRVLHLRVRLVNAAIATSGNYRLYREGKGGKIYSHIVDPRGGGKAPGQRAFRSVSVIHESAATADAWATALFVLGETEGLRKAEAVGIAACFLRLEDEGEVSESMTAGFRKRLLPE